MHEQKNQKHLSHWASKFRDTISKTWAGNILSSVPPSFAETQMGLETNEFRDI